MNTYDVIIIGSGASGMFAAAAAVQRGRSIAIIDMGVAPARKVAVSGGGRCNFTNTAAARDTYFGENPDFVRGVLARVTPNDILTWAAQHGLRTVEKASGQYFCATGAADIVRALQSDIRGAKQILNTTVVNVTKSDDIFTVHTNNGEIKSRAVIVASGGVSFPTLGVTDIGYKIAKSFGHKIVPVRPALCAIATDVFSNDLSGISVRAQIQIGKSEINDSLLFTHFGIGGPAAYRATVRDINSDIKINLLPNTNVFELLKSAKTTRGKKSVQSVLGAYLPTRVAKWAIGDVTKNIADYKDTELQQIANKINNIVIPRGNYKLHGMQSAEVVRGGVSTAEISPKTMESKLCSGLFLAGEVIDIAGDLGGFNLHWAWATGRIAGQNA